VLVHISVPDHLQAATEARFCRFLAISEPFRPWENGLAPGVRIMSPVQRHRRRYAPGPADSTIVE
jgi:hypothetical protein